MTDIDYLQQADCKIKEAIDNLMKVKVSYPLR